MWYISLAKGPSTDPVLHFLICIETCLEHKFPVNSFSAHNFFFFISPNLNKPLKIQNDGKQGNLNSEGRCCTILCIHHTFFSRLKHSTFSSRRRRVGKRKTFQTCPGTWRLDIAEEVLPVGLCWEQGHPHTRGRRGSQPSEVPPVRCWPPASRALITHLPCF